MRQRQPHAIDSGGRAGNASAALPDYLPRVKLRSGPNPARTRPFGSSRRSFRSEIGSPRIGSDGDETVLKVMRSRAGVARRLNSGSLSALPAAVVLGTRAAGPGFARRSERLPPGQSRRNGVGPPIRLRMSNVPPSRRTRSLLPTRPSRPRCAARCNVSVTSQSRRRHP